MVVALVSRQYYLFLFSERVGGIERSSYCGYSSFKIVINIVLLERRGKLIISERMFRITSN